MGKLATRLLSLIMTAGLVLPWSAAAAPAAPAAPSTPAAPSFNRALKQSATGLYIVQLADAPLANYKGGIAGLAATSPRATGSRSLNTTDTASRRYLNYLAAQRQTTLRAIAQTIGGQPAVAQVYDTALNGMALRISQAQAQQIQGLPGVKRVAPDEVMHPQTDTGPGFIGAAQVGDAHAPALFKATLNGASTNSAIFTYNAISKILTYQIGYSGVTNANPVVTVRAGSATGTVLYTLPNTAAGANIGTVTLNPNGQAVAYTGGLYLNIGNEVSGQIVPNQGEGVIVGVLDSGINFTHKSFAATGADGYAVTNPLGAGKYKGACDPNNLPAASAGNPSGYNPAITCNAKLIGVWTFAAVADEGSPIGEPSPADDAEGHGSHTASTAAGNIVSSEIKIPSVSGTSTYTNTGTVGGVAPHANIIAYDVCVTEGCPTSAIVAAIEQAIKDGVNVINQSLGGGSDDPWADLNAQAFLSAFEAGIAVSVSAGNEGPGAETISSPSNAPWVMSAAASTHNRVYLNSLTGLAGGTNPPPTLVGKGFSNGTAGVLPIVYAGAAPYNNPKCQPFASSTSVAGLIVVCDRGTNGRVEKSQNVAKAGGAGFVLANNEASGTSLNGDVYPIPSVHITYADGVALKAWLVTGGTHSGRITGAVKNLDAANGDVMASFSSRGPDATALDVLKPDISAPGVDIIAAVGNTDPLRDEFDIYSGTSMASPHNTGSMALLHEAHPTWTPNEIFSALMTTAITSTVKNDDGTPAGPFDDGAGRIDVSRAALAGLVLDETAQTYSDADPSAGGEPSTLNRPSMMNSQCVVTCTWTRTFRNTLPAAATWNATTTVSGSLSLAVQPASFTVAPGATQTVTVTANVGSLAQDAYDYGTVVLTEAAGRAPAAHLPAVVKPVASDLPASIEIHSSAATGSQKITGIRTIAITNAAVNVYGLAKARLTNAEVAQDSDNTSTFDNIYDGGSIQSVNVPTNTARFVTQVVTTTATDLDMYVFLDGGDGSTPDGMPQQSELACSSATGSALESCDIPQPDAGRYFILVNNYESSAAGKDVFTLATGVVPATNAGNMTVAVPKTQPAGQLFDATVTWNVPRTPGDRWYGAFDLGTDPNNAGNLGYTTVDLASTATPHIAYLPIIGKR